MLANQMTVEIENLKCDGCENMFLKGLMSIAGVAGVIVDHAQKAVVFEADTNLRPQIVAKLLGMGYPEKGSVAGLDKGITTAKSFVSCAIGRIS
jgi:copper chaperone